MNLLVKILVGYLLLIVVGSAVLLSSGYAYPAIPDLTLNLSLLTGLVTGYIFLSKKISEPNICKEAIYSVGWILFTPLMIVFEHLYSLISGFLIPTRPSGITLAPVILLILLIIDFVLTNVFAFIALYKLSKNKKLGGKWYAIAAIVFGIILLIWIIMLLPAYFRYISIIG